MKKVFTILSFIFITASVFAQVPQKMSYQAIIRNLNNNLITNTSVGMQISIKQGNVDGNAVYVERQFPTSNSNGLVTIEIGSGIVVLGNFATIDWSNGPYFIKTETDLNGGASYTISGVSELLSVPYALSAKNGLVAYGNINSDGFINAGSNNFTVSKQSTGVYYISWTGSVETYYLTGIVNISTTNGNPRMTSWTSTGGGAVLIIYVYDLNGNLIDDNISFAVFQP